MIADLKRARLPMSPPAEPKRFRYRAGRRTAASALFVLGFMLPSLRIATAQPGSGDLQSKRVQLEVQKLELEVDHLKKVGALPGWLTSPLTGVLGFLAGIATAATTAWVARRTRLGALDQSVHDKRLGSYPRLVKATDRLALYFPSAARIDPQDCGAMGQAMSDWYFAGGGLLMSVEARDAYFRLARALTRASRAEALSVPTFPDDAKDISLEKVAGYRDQLAERLDLDDVEDWCFGSPVSEKEPPCHRFGDYVLLQRLSSDLRGKLSEDLRSRRRPS